MKLVEVKGGRKGKERGEGMERYLVFVLLVEEWSEEGVRKG